MVKRKVMMKPKPKTLSGKVKLKDVETLMRKFRNKGLSPYIKGKGSGRIKIMFE